MFQITKTDDSFENPFFIATVEDNKDPSNNYRVKVRIPDIHPKTITTAQLPWAARVDPTFMGIGDTQSILHAVPEVGSQVLVLAIGNDINSLFYLGCLYKNTPQTPTGERYLETAGMYTKNGEFIGIEKIKNVFHMIWKGDLTFDVEGKIKLGANAIQKAVLGDDLERILQNIINGFNAHTHTGNLGIPTAPPQTPLVFEKVTSNKITVE